MDFRLRSNLEGTGQQQFRGARHDGVVNVLVAVRGYPDGQAMGFELRTSLRRTGPLRARRRRARSAYAARGMYLDSHGVVP